MNTPNASSFLSNASIISSFRVSGAGSEDPSCGVQTGKDKELNVVKDLLIMNELLFQSPWKTLGMLNQGDNSLDPFCLLPRIMPELSKLGFL